MAKVHAHHHHPSPNTFTTATLNVKSNPEMSQKKVNHDVRKASHTADLIGWNEISPKRYFAAIKALGPKWGHYMPHDGHLRIPNPISWKKSVWKEESSGFVKTHGGKAKVSPNRYITWVKLKNRATGKEVVRMNTHLVSGAWSHHDGTTAWRRKMWNTHMRKLDHLVKHFEKQGLDVVVGGDFNRDSYHVLGKDVAYDNKLNVGTHGHSTYDYLMHARSNDLHLMGAHVNRGFASDHDEVVATYSLSGHAKPKAHAAPKHAAAHPAVKPSHPAHAATANPVQAASSSDSVTQSFTTFFTQLFQTLFGLEG